MKKIGLLSSLVATGILLAGCTGGDIVLPEIDVDSIDVGTLVRDELGGAISGDLVSDYFDIYEVSDFHGAVNYSTSESTIGLAKMADYFSKKRAENPGGTIVLSSGDMFQGSAESNLTHGYLVNYSMNIMGFEAMTLGNHEFDWGLEWLKKNSNLAIGDHKIPFLGANVFDKSTNQLLDFLQPSTIITRGDYKVGIIGTIGDNATTSIMKSLVSSLDFKAEAEVLDSEVAKLKEQGCDIVIWSSHRDALQLQNFGNLKAKGIDAVFGGHSHKNIGPNYDSNGVPYLETKNYGKGIAHVRLAVNKLTKEVTCDTEHTEVDENMVNDSTLVEHTEVKKVLNTYNTYIDPIKSQVVGSTGKPLNVTGEYELTNVCVEAMMEEAKTWANENKDEIKNDKGVVIKDAGDIKILGSFHNSKGGVRTDFAAGQITFGNVYAAFPFDNEIVLVKRTGKTIRNDFKDAKDKGFGVRKDESIVKYDDCLKYEDCYFITTDFVALNYLNIEEDDFVRTNIVVRDAVAKKIKRTGSINADNFARSKNVKFQHIKSN